MQIQKEKGLVHVIGGGHEVVQGGNGRGCPLVMPGRSWYVSARRPTL